MIFKLLLIAMLVLPLAFLALVLFNNLTDQVLKNREEGKKNGR